MNFEIYVNLFYQKVINIIHFQNLIFIISFIILNIINWVCQFIINWKLPQIIINNKIYSHFTIN